MSISNPLINMFGHSPIRPLQKHISKVLECTETLIPFMKAMFNKDWREAAKQQEVLSSLEREADILKSSLRAQLPKGLFLPVPRGDLLELLSMQDHIANKAKDIAGLMLGREMQFPEAIAESYKKYLLRCIDACGIAKTAVHCLDELLETGFHGPEVKRIEDMLDELDMVEHETDEMQIKIRRSLFEIEGTLPPINAIFLYKIIEWTGELADRAHSVASRLRILLAR